jgi:hypothetical protein
LKTLLLAGGTNSGLFGLLREELLFSEPLGRCFFLRFFSGCY